MGAHLNVIAHRLFVAVLEPRDALGLLVLDPSLQPLTPDSYTREIQVFAFGILEYSVQCASVHRGDSIIRNNARLGPNSRTMPGAL